MAIAKKVERLSLSPKQQTTTSVAIDKDLLTHGEALKILCSALHTLRESGLDKLELQRLRILVDAIQTYDSVLEKFEKWSEIEQRLLEMDKKIDELKKPKTMRPDKRFSQLGILEKLCSVLGLRRTTRLSL